MVAVSAAAPVAVPVTIVEVIPPETEAIPDALLLHVPPLVASLKPVVNPWHTVKVPRIGVGKAFTVTTAVMMQPVGKV